MMQTVGVLVGACVEGSVYMRGGTCVLCAGGGGKMEWTGWGRHAPCTSQTGRRPSPSAGRQPLQRSCSSSGRTPLRPRPGAVGHRRRGGGSGCLVPWACMREQPPGAEHRRALHACAGRWQIRSPPRLCHRLSLSRACAQLGWGAGRVRAVGAAPSMVPRFAPPRRSSKPAAPNDTSNPTRGLVARPAGAWFGEGQCEHTEMQWNLSGERQ